MVVVPFGLGIEPLGFFSPIFAKESADLACAGFDSSRLTELNVHPALTTLCTTGGATSAASERAVFEEFTAHSDIADDEGVRCLFHESFLRDGLHVLLGLLRLLLLLLLRSLPLIDQHCGTFHGGLE